MITLHTQIIKKDGKKEYVVLPYDEFVKVQEALDDYQDLCCLRDAKEAEKDAPTMSMAEIRAKIGKRASRPRK